MSDLTGVMREWVELMYELPKRYMAKEFPPDLVMEYVAKTQATEKVYIDNKDVIAETPWGDWNSQGLLSTIEVLSKVEEKSNGGNMPVETDVCKPFIHPQTRIPLRGFFEVDSGLVQLFQKTIIPKKSPRYGSEENLSMKGVGTYFDEVSWNLNQLAKQGYLNTRCVCHPLIGHRYIVNVHESTDWDLFELCYPVGMTMRLFDTNDSLTKRKLEEKFYSTAMPQSKYKDLPVVNMGAELNLNHRLDRYKVPTTSVTPSYEEIYLEEQSKFDSFFFFQVLKVPCPNGMM